MSNSPAQVTPTKKLGSQSQTVDRARWARHDGARKDRLYGKVRDLDAALDLLKQSCGTPIGASSPKTSNEVSQTVNNISPISTSDSLLEAMPMLRKIHSPKGSPSKQRKRLTHNTSLDDSIMAEAGGSPNSQSSEDPFVAAAYALMFINGGHEPPPTVTTVDFPTSKPIEDHARAPILDSLRKRKATPHISIPPPKRAKDFTSPATDTSCLYSPPISENGTYLRSISKRSSPTSSTSTPTKPSRIPAPRRFAAKEVIILPEIDDNDDFYAESDEEKQDIKHVQTRRRSTPVSATTTPKCSADFLIEQREMLQSYLAKAGVCQPVEVTSGEGETDNETEDESGFEVSKLLCGIKENESKCRGI
ncbi:hypothetical protein BDR26DRAFT_891585 [Obelidium mucronatum]|nr:hypothetical protein BDR26DRAFT_891585 [Obelidium mucronatum]